MTWSPPEAQSWQPPEVGSSFVPPEASMQAQPDTRMQNIEQISKAIIKAPTLAEGLSQTNTFKGADAGRSATIPVGLAEQIPAGIQAVESTVAKVAGGIEGLLTPGDTAAAGAARRQKEMSELPEYKFLTPRTEAGQYMTGAIGGAIGRGQEALQDPEFYSKKGIDPKGPVAAAGVFLSEIAPDLAILYGLKGQVKAGFEKPKAKGPQPDFSQLPKETPPPAPGEPPPVPPSFWKDRAMAMYEEAKAKATEEQGGPTHLIAGPEGEITERQKTVGAQFGGETPVEPKPDISSEQLRTMEEEGGRPATPATSENFEKGVEAIARTPLSSDLWGAEMLGDRAETRRWVGADTSAEDGLHQFINPKGVVGEDGLTHHSIDLKSALDHLAKNSTNVLYQIMAGAIAPLIDKIGVEGQIVRDAHGNEKSVLSASGATGNFNTWYKVLSMTDRGLTPAILLHEAVHAVTSRAMMGALKSLKASGKGIYEVNPYAPNAKSVKALVEAFNAVVRHAEEHGIDTSPAMLKMKALAGNDLHYGLIDPKEMVAEALSSVKFRQWLNGILIPVEGGHISMWGKIQKGVRDLLGLDTADKVNALEHIVKHTFDVMEDYGEHAKDVDSQFKFMAYAEGYGVEHLANMIEKGPEELRRIEAVTKLPGLKGQEWIPEPGKFEDNKAKIMKEKDGGINPDNTTTRVGNVLAHTNNAIAKYLSNGYITLSNIRDSTLLKTLGMLGNNGEKVYDLFRKQIIHPLEDRLTKLLRTGENAELLRKIFIKEMNDGKRYSEEDWKKTGVSQDVLDSYLHLRDVFDKVFEWTNANRASRGLKPITREEAYLASRWNHGGYRADLYDKSGKKVWAFSEGSHYDLKKALEWAQKQFPDLEMKNKRFVNINDRKNSLASAYHEMIDFLPEGDPRTDMIKSLYQQMHDVKTENVAGFEKHMVAKAGVRGYLGDRPWTKDNAKDLFASQLSYVKAGARWNAMQEAFQEAHKYLDDPDIRKSQPINTSYGEDYIKNKMGFGGNALLKRLENSFFSQFGKSAEGFTKGLGIGKSLFYITELSYKVPFMVVTLYQHAFAFAQNAYLVGKGYGHWNPARSFINGQRYGNLHVLLDSADATLGMTGKPKLSLPYGFDDPVFRGAREYAHANNLLEQNPLTENADIEKGYVHSTLENAFNLPTAMTEKMSRAWSYYNFVDQLKNSGKFDLKDQASLKDMFHIAEKAVKEVHGDYSPTERAMLFQKMGLMGKQAAALKTYLITMNQQLVHYSHEAGKGNVLPLALFMAAQFGIGGSVGFFGVRTLDEVWNFFRKHILGHFPSAFNKVKDFTPMQYMAKNMDDLLYQGPISKMTGTNLYVSGSMGNIIPWEMKEWFPAITENIQKLLDAGELGVGAVAQQLGMPDWLPHVSPNETKQALYEFAPAGARGLIREEVPGFKHENPDQSELMMNPRNLRQGLYTREPGEQTVGKLGFVPNKEQRVVEQMREGREQEEMLKHHRELAVDHMQEYLMSGNREQLTKFSRLFFDFGGTQAELQEELSKSAFNKFLDEKQKAYAYLQKGEGNYEKTKQAIDFLHAIGEGKEIKEIPTSNIEGR